MKTEVCITNRQTDRPSRVKKKQKLIHDETSFCLA